MLRIYYVHCTLDRVVHAQALGFTDRVMNFARGESENDALERTRKHYRTKYNIGVKQADARLALHQDAKRYTFPEQII